MPYKDPDKARKWQREWVKKKYHSNTEFREKAKAATKKSKKKHTLAAKILLAEFRKDGCLECDEINPDALCAHHRKAKDKKAHIGRLISCNAPIKKVAEELKKCICLCLNCHAKLHARQRRED
jgi:hypothetical protein